MSGKRSKRERRGLRPPAWTPFVEMAPITINGVTDRVWVNSLYQVNVRAYNCPGWPGEEVLHLSIKTREKCATHDWRHFQLIKNQVTTLYGWGDGEKCEAVELYPAEYRLVDTSNQYHLWVLTEGIAFPFGFPERAVVDTPIVGPTGSSSVQRPFDEGLRPKDCMTGPEFLKAVPSMTSTVKTGWDSDA